MKNYIVSEEELYKLINECEEDIGGNMGNEYFVKDFLKSKQPIELVESGLVQGDFGYNLFDDYKGKSIEVYIQVKE